MFDPSAIGKALALVQRVKNVQHANCDAERQKVAELAGQQVSQPGECSLVQLELDGKPVTIAVWGPVGTRDSLPI